MPLAKEFDHRIPFIRFLPILLSVLTLIACVFMGGVAPVIISMLSGLEVFLLLAAISVWPFIYIAKTRYSWLVFAAFCLFGVVQFEPAPVDILFFAIIPFGVISGALSFSRLRNTSLIQSIIWFFLLITLASLLASSETIHSLRYTIITVYCIGITYFTKMYVVSANEMRPIMTGYLVGALISVGLVALDYAGLAPPEVFAEQTRARGLFKDANVFGPFLIPPILLLVEEIWRPAILQKWPISLRLASVMVLIAGVFLSFSRAAWGNLIVTFMVYFAFNLRYLSRKQLMAVFWLVVGSMIALVGLVIALDLIDFLLYRAAFLQGYDSERFEAQSTGIRLGITHLFGIGPGMMDLNGLFAPHSLYIRSIAEHGVFGLLSLCFLLCALLYPVGMGAVRSQEKVLGLSRSMVFAVAIGIFLNSFLIDTIHWRHFWFILGLLWLMHPVVPKETAISVAGRQLTTVTK